MEDSELQNFIKQVVSKSQESTDYDRALTEKELKELALSMGLTEEQWQELQRKARVHVYAAESFLRRQEYANGIAEAEKAVAINPYVMNGYAYLALGYFQRFEENGAEEDRIQAEFSARKALDLNPQDQKMINIISALAKKKRGGAKDKKTMAIVAAALVVMMGVGMMVFMIAQKDTSKSDTVESNEGIRNQLIEAEEEVLRIQQEIRVEQERKNSLISEYANLIPASPNSDKIKASLKDAIASGDQNAIEAKLSELQKSLSNSQNSETIQLQMVQIEGAENRIAYQKGELAKAVRNYNVLVKKHGNDFPEFKLMEYEGN